MLNNHPFHYHFLNKQILSLLLTVIFACVLYKLLDYYSLKHSAALFIGIPVFMASLLAITPNITHITRHIIIGMSLGLIASFIFLKEGSFCVPMTAPLFLLSGVIIGFCFSKFKLLNYKSYIYLLPVAILLTLAFEGTTSSLTIDRNNTVEFSRVTTLSAKQINTRLSQNRQFKTLPFLLSWGFPQPASVSGEGTNIGDFRSIYFSGGEGKPGHAVFKIVERTENSITFALLKDESHISHWLKWKSSKVSWQTLDSGDTRITWTIDYERKLDPSWYFGPLQKYAVELATEALIDNMIL